MSGDLFVILAFTAVALVIVAMTAWIRAWRDSPLDYEQLTAVQARWHEPEELRLQATPRDVRLTSAGRTTFALTLTFGVVLVAVGLMLIPGMRRQAADNELIRTEGARGTATVMARRKSGGRHTSYYVTYDYTVAGVRYSAQAEVTSHTYARSTTGAELPIHYLPSRPDAGLLDDAVTTSPWSTLALFIPAVVLLIMAWRLWLQKNLLASGTPVGAIVTRTVRTKSGRSIRYQFLDPTGQPVTGTDVVPSIMAPQQGDIITVLFDHGRTVKTASYPMRYVELNSASQAEM
jgi:hypothetical protein